MCLTQVPTSNENIAILSMREFDVEDSAVAVLSDAHFGDRSSWLETPSVHAGVVDLLKQRSDVSVLVLLGDTLDLNFGSLTTAIEGRLRGTMRRPGFRAFMAAVCQSTSVRKIIYIPGNHDYMIWDWEARQRNVLEPLGAGHPLSGTMLQGGMFSDPFLAGVLPEGHRENMMIVFPHLVLKLSENRVVLTHGHVLDRIQNGGVKLASIADTADRRVFFRRLSIASAQYQMFAHTIAVRRSTRRGTHTWYHRITGLHDRLSELRERIFGLRNKAPSQKILRDIGLYVTHVVGLSDAHAFVFGHTHLAGVWTCVPSMLNASPMKVYNCGSFLPPGNRNASMLILTNTKGNLIGEIIAFSRSGTWDGQDS